MGFPLEPLCRVCNSNEELKKCGGCKVVTYCGSAHQTLDWGQHKSLCIAVKKAQNILNHEETELRATPGDWMTPAGDTLFTEHVGRFWGILATRTYMRARYSLVEALTDINTRQALQSALDHIMDLLRLSRGDNLGVRAIAPGLMLRLGHDQDCYDFVKWWSTTGGNQDYDSGDMSLGFLDIKNADIFESNNDKFKRFELSHAIATTLIKIRVLSDLKALQNSAFLGKKAPQEIIDNIRSQLAGGIVQQRKDIMESNDLAAQIAIIEAHLLHLYDSVKKGNIHFWPALVKPGNNLNAKPSAYVSGSPEHMQLNLLYNYKAWAETPGAIDVIKKMVMSDSDFGN